MATVERRLGAVVDALEPKERALLVLRAWLAEDAPEMRRLRLLCPMDQEEETEDWVSWANDGYEYVTRAVVVVEEWIVQIDMQLGWLETLRAFEGTLAGRKAALSLPVIRHGWRRAMTLHMGTLVEADREEPPAMAELGGVLEHNVRLGLELRYRDLELWRHRLALLGEEFGEGPLVHDSLAEAFVEIEAKLQDIRSGMEALTGPLALRPANAEELAEVEADLPERPRPNRLRRG